MDSISGWTKKVQFNLVLYVFFISLFPFLNLFSISFLFIALKGSKKVKDKAIKYICFTNVMEILYLLKAFSEVQWFFYAYLRSWLFLLPGLRSTLMELFFFSFQTWFVESSGFWGGFVCLIGFANSRRCSHLIGILANIWKLLTVWRKNSFVWIAKSSVKQTSWL